MVELSLRCLFNKYGRSLTVSEKYLHLILIRLFNTKYAVHVVMRFTNTDNAKKNKKQQKEEANVKPLFCCFFSAPLF